MPDLLIKSGMEVAIVPRRTSPPADAWEIATVLRVGQVYIQLTDSRMFATIGRVGLNTGGYIVPATDEHRAALLAKADKSA
jgi:hypothetical protein